VLTGPRAGCARVDAVRATAGYNGRGPEANGAGVEAELRNDAAAHGGNAVVFRARVVGAPPVDAPRAGMNSGGCPNCVTMTADVYRCPAAPAAAPPPAPAPPAPPVATAALVDPAAAFAPAADAALAAATESARRCLPPGTPGGEARVRMTFAPTGDVVYAEVEGEGFAGTAAGACVAEKLRNAHVPPFAGAPRALDRALKIVP
jgi:hypothetical protein